jgi:hypothetical protein
VLYEDSSPFRNAGSLLALTLIIATLGLALPARRILNRHRRESATPTGS